MFKVFAFAFLLIAAIQASPKIHQKTTKDLTDDANALLEELRQVIDAAKLEAQTDLDAAVQEVHNHSVEVKTAANEELQRMVNDTVAKVEGPIETVLNCVEQSGIQNLPATIFDELKSCIDAEVNKAIAIVNQTITDIQAFENLVVNLEKRVINCNGNILCLGSLILEVSNAIVEIPAKIFSDLQAAIELIQSIPADVEACATQKINMAEIAIVNALQNILTCIENSIS